MNKQHINEIILYQPDNSIQLEVRIENEMVWLTQAQIAKLFGVKQPAISKHLKNIFLSGELNEKSVYSILEYTASDNKTYNTGFYNLDAILSIGYRVNSKNATLFRIWANSVLKDYLLKGYAINYRLENLENRVSSLEHNQTEIKSIIQKSLPLKEGVFFDGQIFDAYTFISDLIKSAKKSIILIDNYIDNSILLLLSKRAKSVNATIYTSTISSQLQLDLQKHNAQYTPITIKTFTRSHDRFLFIDENVYHIGASLKDLGKRWFAFSKMELEAKMLLQNI
ncbi:MAG: virulence RhuM family protein [Bacteroidetes bacterium]|nr:virulence RhuM family protein [Bacteroidota bacterium]